MVDPSALVSPICAAATHRPRSFDCAARGRDAARRRRAARARRVRILISLRPDSMPTYNHPRKEVSMRHAFAAAVLLFALSLFAQDMPNGHFAKLPGMSQYGMITREANGIPHVFAFNGHDLMFLNGWLHAQDRLFQMDTNRRIASGTLGELLGRDALSNDVQLRTFGLRRAAQASLSAYGAAAKSSLDAYAEGVNAYISTHPLP